jgi:hypothetical protein
MLYLRFIGVEAIMSTPSRITRSATEAKPIAGRKYVSPAQLEDISPYSRHSWRGWYYSGKLHGCLKPAGKRGRLLIPLDEAEKFLREGRPDKSVASVTAA